MPSSETAPASLPVNPTSARLDRDLSWLEFNRRVLWEARDPRNPLLERVRFLSIFNSNLDEFFMKRVGALRSQLLARRPKTRGRLQGRKVQDLLALLGEIRTRVNDLLALRAEAVTEELLPELKAQGVRLLLWEELTDEERGYCRGLFEDQVFPTLTPLAVDPAHPFPFISGLSASFGVLMNHPDTPSKELFARLKVPTVFPTWLSLPSSPSGEIRLASLYDLIAVHLSDVFPGMEIRDAMMFRVTRNAELSLEDVGQDSDDLLEMMEESLKERRFGDVVRLEHGLRFNARVKDILLDELDIKETEVYPLPHWFEYAALNPLLDLPRPDLKFKPWRPVVPRAFAGGSKDLFEVIRREDVLVHHPYESFSDSTEAFISRAVKDPLVVAIKMTLYRTGAEGSFVPMLIRAAERGKQIACMVELQARFEEERNIAVARALEKAGVHVVYGIVGLKTHCKMALVTRKESDGFRTYLHLGTGNYHSHTAQLYTDFGLFTADPVLTRDAVLLFHYLTGRSASVPLKRLLVAPLTLKQGILERIAREKAHAEAGRPAGIVAQMNGLEDAEVMNALSEAARAGVRVQLVVRGVCCLIPGVPGQTEGIEVKSVLGRFLEHARLIHFRNGGATPVDGEFWMGSADWMNRNLEMRVEALAPILAPALKERCWQNLSLLAGDHRQSWRMTPQGTYERMDPVSGELGAHGELMARALKR